MFSHRTIRQFTAWLAAMVVLCAGLLPLVSHAVVLHLSGAAGMVQVCTVSGMAWVNLDVASTPADAQPGQTEDTAPGMNMANCNWCAMHTVQLGVPPAPVALALPTVLPPVVPSAFLHAHHPLFAWAAAQPRAPPISA